MCLEVAEWHAGQMVAFEPGANAQQWEYIGGRNQMWRFESVGGDLFAIYNRLSGMCLEVAGWDGGQMVALDEGANIRQWEYVGGGNQKWRVVWVGSSHTYQIENASSGMCLSVANMIVANGANIHQLGCKGTDNQKWYLDRLCTVADANEPGVADGCDFEAADVSLSHEIVKTRIEYVADTSSPDARLFFDKDRDGHAEYMALCQSKVFSIYAKSTPDNFTILQYTGTPSINGNVYEFEFPASAIGIAGNPEFGAEYWFYSENSQDRMPDSGSVAFP